MKTGVDVAKILVTGPFNAGKTTLIQFISSEQLLSRDVKSTDKLARFKAMTTVGLDFGILHVDDTLDVHLFGTPGQARFNFMWEILSKGALGTIFLVDSSSQRAIDEAKLMYAYYSQKTNAPIVIGATKQDLEGAISSEALAEAIGVIDHVVIPCDTRKKEDSLMLVFSLLEQVIAEDTVDDDEFSF